MDKSITYITVCRSRFSAKPIKNIELWHAAVHIVVDGKTEVWQYGRYNGINGTLVKRNGGKRNDQQIITSCKLNNPLPYSTFVNFSKNYCQGKSWYYTQDSQTTNCQYYAKRVLEQFTTNQCVNLMFNQIKKNWKEAIEQGAAYYAQQMKTTLQDAINSIIYSLTSP